MATVELTNVIERFPVGTTVNAYADSGRSVSGQPPGSSAASAAVQADGSLTLTGLADDTAYILYAVVSTQDRYMRVSTQTSASDSARVVVLTQAEYDDISDPDDDTLYVIVEA